MRSVGSHSTLGREKEGNKERTVIINVVLECSSCDVLPHPRISITNYRDAVKFSANMKHRNKIRNATTISRLAYLIVLLSYKHCHNVDC